MNANPNELQQPIRLSFLSVGTRLLLKDNMDLFIRAAGPTLGDYRTHYASNQKAALRVIAEQNINILFLETELPDGTAYSLLKAVGGATLGDMYVVLALEERNEAMLALAQELEVHAILVKPFSGKDVSELLQRYAAWKTMTPTGVAKLVREATDLTAQQDYAKAEQKFLEALKIEQKSPQLFKTIGDFYVKRNDWKNAEQFYTRCLEQKPDMLNALQGLASVQIQQNKLEPALEHLKKAQKLSPLNPDRPLGIINLHWKLALEASKDSLRIDRNHLKAREAYAHSLLLLKNYKDAALEFETVLKELKDLDERKTIQTYIALAKKLAGIRS